MIHFYSINFQTRFPRESNTRYRVIFIYMEKKRYLSETIKFFHESRRGKFRNLPTSPFHSNISHIATRICVRLALPMPDRSTLWLRTWMLTITFVACQMRRRIGDTRNFPSREWNSRDSNCFRKGLRCKDVIIEDTSLRSNFRIKYRDDIIIYIRLEYSTLNYLFVLIIRIYICIYTYISFFFRRVPFFLFFTNLNLSMLRDWKGNFGCIRVCIFRNEGGNSLTPRVGREFSVDWV